MQMAAPNTEAVMLVARHAPRIQAVLTAKGTSPAITSTSEHQQAMAANGSTNCSLSVQHGAESKPEHQSDSQGSQTSSSWVDSLLPKLVMTRPREDVPLLFREPHVTHGFRQLHQPWLYYFCSVLQLHNESVNVWTHLVALVLMISKLSSFCYRVDFVGDPYSWPLLAGLFCGILLYAFSSGAHCLQSKSELVHYTSFMVDYAGIGLYGLGSTIVHLWYCSEDVFYDSVKEFFVPLGGILAFLICYCCSVAKVIYRRPYPFSRKLWQMSPVASIYVVLISPIIHRLLTCFVYGVDCTESIRYHVQQVFWFMMSGIFFASDFPQRLKPGLFNHFFHSHQIFHVCIMICTLIQMDGVFIDFQTRSDVFRKRPAPTFSSAFGPVIIVCIAELISIVAFTLHVKNTLVTEKKK